MDFLLPSILALVGLEAGTAALVHGLRKNCKWLITPGDLRPAIDKNGLERFLDHGWDAEIGWIRKPNTSHDEVAKDGGVSTFHIDANGARRNPQFEHLAPGALVYGDSYAFSRQVNDDQTWAHQLSKKLDLNLVNKGVGNYGLDQALLRLEREFDGSPAPLVIMAVVPETISRILSVWKHFSEYGNIFAFKPRFVLEDDNLILRPNPVDTPDKYLRIDGMLGELMDQDYFYRRKFKPDMLRFPYIWHLLRSRRRNFPLMTAALKDRVIDGEHAFTNIMERNISLSAEIFLEKPARDLFAAICLRMRDFVRARKSEAGLVFMPQMMDIAHIRRHGHHYRPLLDRLEGLLPVVDLAPAFLPRNDLGSLFIDDRYGGHYSAHGNRMVAEKLQPVCRKFLPHASTGITGSIGA